MAKGIIYICSTVVKGLIKIGKTTDFESRMKKLEADGYHNIAGLKREFAIEVDNFDEKEALIHNVFSKSQVDGSELFTLDIEIAKQLLSSFDGTIIYPIGAKKTEIFEEATEALEVAEEEVQEKKGRAILPKLDWLLKQDVVKPGDKIYYKKKSSEKAEILKKGNVKYNGETMSLLDFAKKMTGWEHVNAYRHLVLERENKTLFELRAKKMKDLGL